MRTTITRLGSRLAYYLVSGWDATLQGQEFPQFSNFQQCVPYAGPRCCRGLFFSSEAPLVPRLRPGHFWRSCVRGKAPPPCSRLRRARGFPTHSCGTEARPPASQVRRGPCSTLVLKNKSPVSGAFRPQPRLLTPDPILIWGNSCPKAKDGAER